MLTVKTVMSKIVFITKREIRVMSKQNIVIVIIKFIQWLITILHRKIVGILVMLYAIYWSRLSNLLWVLSFVNYLTMHKINEEYDQSVYIRINFNYNGFQVLGSWHFRLISMGNKDVLERQFFMVWKKKY